MYKLALSRHVINKSFPLKNAALLFLFPLSFFFLSFPSDPILPLPLQMDKFFSFNVSFLDGLFTEMFCFVKIYLQQHIVQMLKQRKQSTKIE